MPKPKQPVFPTSSEVEELAEDLFTLCEQIGVYGRDAGDTASSDEIEVVMRAASRIARDASQAVVALQAALRLARTREDIARMEQGK
jgi:hypothetical protein